GTRVAVGPPTDLAGAADSLRWARTALRLVAGGALPDVPVTWCAEHLTTLWLLSDAPLVDQLADRELAPLAGFPARTRLRLGETLLSWLEHGGNSERIAVELSVHPQTVRYRVKQLKQAFGERLEDADARFAMQAALRASGLRGSPCPK
ncbi:helix-turn-helix domain-containing protein, partial [Amycolatopsis sp. SID8362]|uniref:PucR family transcriptional regulator n=1 Tax=Amycolatopsis sp. SID8362 TaxID=2690346 RepID=UPI001369000B